jgi:hypothetical protein
MLGSASGGAASWGRAQREEAVEAGLRFKRFQYGTVPSASELATTAARDPSGELATLDHYELPVPGTRTLARYFAMQPAFAGHPLRARLTTGRAG